MICATGVVIHAFAVTVIGGAHQPAAVMVEDDHQVLVASPIGVVDPDAGQPIGGIAGLSGVEHDSGGDGADSPTSNVILKGVLLRQVGAPVLGTPRWAETTRWAGPRIGRSVRVMDLPDALKDAQMKGMNLLHRTVLAVSGGRVGGRLGCMPVVELHTVGRITGRRRSVVLTAPVYGEGRWVLVASKGGDDRQPDWYRNVVAHREVELTVNGKTVAVNACTATDAEKAELWPQVVATYRGYATYQTNTNRNIPLVICTRR